MKWRASARAGDARDGHPGRRQCTRRFRCATRLCGWRFMRRDILRVQFQHSSRRPSSFVIALFLLPTMRTISALANALTRLISAARRFTFSSKKAAWDTSGPRRACPGSIRSCAGCMARAARSRIANNAPAFRFPLAWLLASTARRSGCSGIRTNLRGSSCADQRPKTEDGSGSSVFVHPSSVRLTVLDNHTRPVPLRRPDAA